MLIDDCTLLRRSDTLVDCQVVGEDMANMEGTVVSEVGNVRGLVNVLRVDHTGIVDVILRNSFDQSVTLEAERDVGLFSRI